jgi:ABC-2 type transport system permease protein
LTRAKQEESIRILRKLHIRDNAVTDSSTIQAQGERRFGRFNLVGFQTLLGKEVRRFLKVYQQTLLAPAGTALLFMAVFTLALGDRRGEVFGVPFAQFLAPGIIMMAILQNAFANASSSLVVAKVQGNIIDVLMPPLSAGELTTAYALGGVMRGLAVASVAALVIFPFAWAGIAHPLWALSFAVIGALIFSLCGAITGIWAEKFDHTALVTNFIITPLAFLSGTFYSIDILPEPWRTLSAFNPVHFLIDGFRYGVLGRSDTNPWLGMGVSLVIAALLWALCHWMFRTGYRLKS